jgi:hypothetical protein
LTITFGLSTYLSTQRLLIGYNTNNNSAPTATVDPSTFLNIIGLSKDAGDSTLQFITNNGSGTGTKINTGVTPSQNNIYRLTVVITPQAGAAVSTGVYITLETITKTGISTVNSGSITTKIPAAGTALQPVMYVNTAAGSSSVAFNFIHMTQERFI